MPLLKLVFSVLAVSGLVYLALCGWLWLGQRQLMFLPTAALETTPRAFGLPYNDVWIPVDAKGSPGRVHGWWLPSEGAQPLTFLYLHGNAGNISSTLDRVMRLRALGASVLTIDYRGYGQSSGPFPSEQRLYQDALAACRFLQVEKGVASQHLVIYGHSLGGAIGINVAGHIPQLAGLIVEGSFTAMADMATRSSYNRWFPVQQLLTQRFDSINKVKDLKVPVLYIHGLADASVPAVMSEQLYAATTAPKELWLVPNADHNDLAAWAGDDLERRIWDFLSDYVLVNH
ncbi:MAG: alpha/beta hydrolase [Nodosilinea sp.]